MRAVKSTNTKPEMRIRRMLHGEGYRYRLHRRDLPGTPDLTFASRRKIVFVHGCFWHGHDCKRGDRQPKTNADYWRRKIRRNRERDAEHLRALDSEGWAVHVVWECEIRRDSRAVLDRLRGFLGPPGSN